jgi:hypothetical protein
VAVPIYGDMAKFIEMQPRTSEHLFARGAKPIRDFRESWDLACERAGIPDLLSMISVAQRFGICGGPEYPKPSL